MLQMFPMVLFVLYFEIVEINEIAEHLILLYCNIGQMPTHSVVHVQLETIPRRSRIIEILTKATEGWQVVESEREEATETEQ